MTENKNNIHVHNTLVINLTWRVYCSGLGRGGGWGVGGGYLFCDRDVWLGSRRKPIHIMDKPKKLNLFL